MWEGHLGNITPLTLVDLSVYEEEGNNDALLDDPIHTVTLTDICQAVDDIAATPIILVSDSCVGQDSIAVQVDIAILESIVGIDVTSIHHVFSEVPMRNTLSPSIKMYLLKPNKIFQPGIQLYTQQIPGNVGSMALSIYKKLNTTLTIRAADAPL
jgi:hypothetical protein